jgi:hypothetical protein
MISNNPFNTYYGVHATPLQTIQNPRASMTLYGLDDELNSEAGADLVIGSDQKPLRGNTSPESCR